MGKKRCLPYCVVPFWSAVSLFFWSLPPGKICKEEEEKEKEKEEKEKEEKEEEEKEEKEKEEEKEET
ncbi:hypothetical protein C0J52_01596 [Blattella germanica]|nr:hypothetical protein C0J52_01596 [Blattella germanica]